MIAIKILYTLIWIVKGVKDIVGLIVMGILIKIGIKMGRVQISRGGMFVMLKCKLSNTLWGILRQVLKGKILVKVLKKECQDTNKRMLDLIHIKMMMMVKGPL